MSFIRVAAIVTLLAAALVACATETVQPPSKLSTPSGPVEGDTITGKANVENLEILILESFPVQVHALATGYLPDACTQIDQVVEELTGNTFLVTITTVRPADAVCAEVEVDFQESIPLDVMGLPAGRNTVDVNGVRASFELAIDNVPPEEPAQ